MLHWFTIFFLTDFLKVKVKFYENVEVLNLNIFKEGGPPIVGRDYSSVYCYLLKEKIIFYHLLKIMKKYI